jgi:hypothetical protein
MKNKILIGGVSIVLTAVAFFVASIVKGTINSKPDESKSVQASAADTSRERVSLKQTRYKALKTKDVSTFPVECAKALDELAAQTMEETMIRLKSNEDFDHFFPKDCQAQLRVHKIFTDLADNSQCNFLTENFTPSESCSSVLFALKAFTIADNTKDVPVSHMTSEEMAAHFVKMFFSFDQLNQEGYAKNLELINTLLERHGDDANVLEAYLGYAMIGEQITGSTIAQEKSRQILEANMGKHFKVDRLSVLQYVAKKDFGGAKVVLDRLSESYAQEPELKYYYAAYFWKQGDRVTANQYLDQAIAMGEKCSYCVPGLYKETKARMKNAKNGDDKLFSISIGLNFENL